MWNPPALYDLPGPAAHAVKLFQDAGYTVARDGHFDEDGCLLVASAPGCRPLQLMFARGEKWTRAEAAAEVEKLLRSRRDLA